MANQSWGGICCRSPSRRLAGCDVERRAGDESRQAHRLGSWERTSTDVVLPSLDDRVTPSRVIWHLCSRSCRAISLEAAREVLKNQTWPSVRESLAHPGLVVQGFAIVLGARRDVEACVGRARRVDGGAGCQRYTMKTTEGTQDGETRQSAHPSLGTEKADARPFFLRCPDVDNIETGRRKSPCLSFRHEGAALHQRGHNEGHREETAHTR
ncbi:hypothetical protein BCV69DRAFT_189508 [Microstroma glucosiphilum]|uniref:Uncharacterized protein n=1 Tax=Pseudomicrostroma glucosiphilum TaxID=1684307 RepID=A0A316U8K0_9BASI|nr:hypothetical protein BCV69DRAFT_189508 [Pseudomicrostroma glucosiphilum]PWN21178.1 hypothetical protein BCV69DRAFT_189508 [Pseudomicrostroma glucosiphilum]